MGETLEMEQLDRHIAEALGWAPKGEQPWWRIPVGGTAEYVLEHDLPRFTTSIDAQHRHADKAVEERWGRCRQMVYPVPDILGGGWEYEFQTDEGHNFCGTGDTLAAARAAAILEALKQ